MVKTYIVNLDLKSLINCRTGIVYTRGDVRTNVFVVNLRDGTTPYNLTNVASATFTFKKPSGLIVVGSATITDPLTGTIEYTCGTQELLELGTLLATVQLYNVGGDKLTTPRMEITIQGELDSGPTTPSSSIGSYEQRLTALENPIKFSVIYDPGVIVAGTSVSTTIATVIGAIVGDIVVVAHSQPRQGVRIDAEVTATNTVTVSFTNDTAGDITILSGTLAGQILPS